MPNILFIAADDLVHVDRLLSLLIPGFDLPNLRRLADTGTDFNRAYCAVPVCEPARTAVMTGLSPADTKSFDLSVGWENLVHPRNTWLYQLRKAGFHTGTTGKVFHGYRPQPASVYRELYDSPPFETGPFNPATPIEDRGGMYGQVYAEEAPWYDASRANDTIHALAHVLPTDRPWYWECGFHHPHLAWTTPARIHDRVALDDVIMPSDWKGGFDTMPFVNEFIVSGTLNYSSSDPADWTEEQVLYVRRTIRNYAAGCLWMDEQLGRVLDALEASAHAGNTVVTFYSDHGYHLSDHGKWHKFTLYEQCALAPMLIRVPGQVPRKVTQPVSHVDLGATILDLCGLPVPESFMGQSLRPWIEGATPAPRAIPTFWYGSVSIAKHDKRVTVYQDGTAEMFDLEADPWSVRNIAATHPDYAALREECILTARAWGMMIVEEAIDTSRPSNIQSFLGTEVTDHRFATSFVALGDLHSKGRSPNHQRMYSNSHHGQTEVRMPPHIEDFQLLGMHSAAIRIVGNALDNKIVMSDVYYKRIELDLGDGDDENVSPGRTQIVAYGGRGNDILRAGTWGKNRLYGEQGNDTLIGDSGDDLLDGGAGDDSLIGGAGNDTLISGSGFDTLIGGEGDDLLINDAGGSDMHGGPGADTFRLCRTGIISYVRDLTEIDTLDLSDWGVLGTALVRQVGSDVEVTAGVEKVICNDTTVATVRARTIGILTVE